MGIFDFLKQKKIRRLPRDWQFFTCTSVHDFEFKTKSPYSVTDDEASNLWQFALTYIQQHAGRERGKESFLCVTSKNLSVYVYHFDDGRRDKSSRWLSNFLMVFVTPDEAKAYTFKDFVEEVYDKKSKQDTAYPTGFDFADKFPVIWNEQKSMESSSKAFLQSHPMAKGDFAFDEQDFQRHNLAWQRSKKENATFLSTTFFKNEKEIKR